MPIELPVEKRFIFNGSAVAFAGRIRRPDDVFVNAAAPCHLPVTGGLSEARIEGPGVDPFLYKNLITFSAAYSRAQGDFSDPRRAVDFTRGNHGQNELPTNTAVQTRLENLQVHSEADPNENAPERTFSASLLEAHLESTSNRRDAVSFRSMAAVFTGVGLTTVEPTGTSTASLLVHTATEIFDANDTKAKLIETFAKDGDFRKQYAAMFYPPGANLPGFLDNLFGKHEIPNADQGPVVATFVTRLEWVGGVAPQGTEILNNRLTISGLGRIYFGEIIIDEGSRRVTLLRFELGSTHGGDASACELVSNGTTWPPHR